MVGSIPLGAILKLRLPLVQTRNLKNIRTEFGPVYIASVRFRVISVRASGFFGPAEFLLTPSGRRSRSVMVIVVGVVVARLQEQ